MVTPEEKLGTIVMELTRRGCFVKLGMKTTIVNGEVLELQATTIRQGKSYTVSEILTPRALADIDDARVVSDAISEKLRKMA